MSNRIKEVRKSKGITLEKLAEELDTYPMTLQRFESGSRNVSLRWLERIAKGLGVQVSDLVSEKQNPPETNDDILIYWIIELCVKSGREYPDLSADILAAIGKTTYRSALAGKLPNIKPKTGSKKPPKSLETETRRLLEYEMVRLN